MRPPKMEYEKVPTDDLVSAVIDIEYDTKHEFKWKKEGVEHSKLGPAVRFIFKNIPGCEYPHRSNWMGLSLGSQATLYNKYVASLVEGAFPFMDFDLDELKGMKIKMLWRTKENGYQEVDTVRPAGAKLRPKSLAPAPKGFGPQPTNGTPKKAAVKEQLAESIDISDEEVPF